MTWWSACQESVGMLGLRDSHSKESEEFLRLVAMLITHSLESHLFADMIITRSYNLLETKTSIPGAPLPALRPLDVLNYSVRLAV